ncbi:MAG: response regulator [Microcystaceae cyanobacterium]
MSSELCHILLIEDESATTALIQSLLFPAVPSSLSQGFDYELSSVTSLEAGLEKLEEQAFDLILLDLNLPNYQGVESLICLRERDRQIAIVVYTEDDHETLVIRAFQTGADGYFRLNSLDSDLLLYEVRSAQERKFYSKGVETQRRLAQQEQEFEDLASLVTSTTSVTARMFGSETLQESLPDIFAELSQTYGNLLDLALEQRAFKVEHRISERLRALADKMGFLKASPRDVVELHTQTLRAKNQDVTIAKAQVYVAEGRLMVLELMGYLVSFYRKYYIGLSNLNRFTSITHNH